MNRILQVVPRVPGGIDGVGDYALTLAAKLHHKFGRSTVFVTPDAPSTTTVRNFEVRPLDELGNAQEFDRVILHYVNYGYQTRGIPFGLVSTLRRMRQQHRGKLLTIFHELYASGPPWSSAFWLQPLQVHLSKAITQLSDACFVSNQKFLSELQRLVPNAQIHLHPTPSGLQEPSLSHDQIAARDPHRWGIVGGTLLSERSLRSFAQTKQGIPESVAPRFLFVLGGNENPVTRSLLADLGIESDYRPRIAASDASEILRTCSFAWINYFHRPDVESSVILKSSAFAAICAHGVVPIFPHGGGPISINGDRLPGPFFAESNRREIPSPQERSTIAGDIYDWYQRHASSELLVRGIADALELSE